MDEVTLATTPFFHHVMYRSRTFGRINRLKKSPPSFGHRNIINEHHFGFNNMTLRDTCSQLHSPTHPHTLTTRAVLGRNSKYKKKTLLTIPFIFILTTSILLIDHDHHSVNCLDSPVKVQRNKLHQQPKYSNVDKNQANGELASTTNESSVQHHINSAFNRVRRTNSEQVPANFQSRNSQVDQLVKDQDQCPSSRLFQSLLPPEYAGSPAISRRPSMARAHCDCVSDPFGWHFTCFSGSALSANSLNNVNNALPMPNQLHPAFRTPQMVRQQQRVSQQQQGRRVNKRSASQSSYDERMINSSTKLSEDISTTLLNEEASPHEGFGEEHSSSIMSATTGPPRTSNLRLKPSASNNSLIDSLIERNIDEVQHQRELRQNEGNLASSANGNRNSVASQLTFQTIPTLFSVKYVRNSMIEIDCDQAAPNYRAAMFQDFNVNEINAFTFNNCQLPSIPFSVLLHRTRSSGASASATIVSDVPSAQNQPPLSPQVGDRSPLAPIQSLRPNRQRPSNGKKRRKRQADQQAENAEVQAAARSPAQPTGRQRSQTILGEPKIKSLTVNLNAVVEQRTLISLLTGLDQLEDLQLNYMQLNLTSFVLGDLSGATTITTSTTTASPTPLDQGSASSLAASSATFTPAPSDNGDDLIGARSSSRAVSEPLSSTSGAQQAATTSTTTTTTTTARPTTSSSTITTTVATQPPTTHGIALRPSRKQQQAPTTTGTVGVASSGQPLQQQQQQTRPPAIPITSTAATSATSQSAAQTTAPQTSASSTTRPPISLGAPRGLVVAQATGIPPTQSAPAPTTAPAQQPAPTAAAAAAPTTSSANLVPSVPLATAVASTRHLSGATQTTPAQTTTASATTMATGPGQRHQQHHASSQNPNLISIGTSQTHSVSYTSTNTNPISATTTGGTAPRTNGPPVSSTLMSSSSSSSSNGASSSLSNTNRLHQTPSAWFATHPAVALQPPAAGSRLSHLSASSIASDILIPAATSSSDAPATVAPPSSMLWSTAASGQTQPITATTASAANAAGNGLNGPHTNTNGANSFGYRTATSSSSFLRSSSSAANNQPEPFSSGAVNQRQRPHQVGTTNSINNQETTSSNFVAAGGRLHPQSPGQQRRQQQVQSNHRQSSSADEEHHYDGATTATDGGHRVRRSTNGLEEFELSLGELLPNLRTLKLESFLDLSVAAAAAASASNARQRNNGPKRGQSHGGGNQLNRFKRQFQPNDMPEKDDDISDSSALTSAANEDALSGEETSMHHNSVMASSSTASSLAHSSAPNSSARQLPEPRQDHPDESDREMDVEPGETLWRAASGQHSSEEESSEESWPGPNVAVVLPPPPTSTTGAQPQRPQQGFAKSHDDGDTSSLFNGDQMGSASEQSMARARYLSQVLVKLFSKLTKLRVLQMTGNEIPYWPDNVLHDSRRSLTRVYLISNNLRQLAPKSFADLTELQTVDLSSNQLRQLDGSLFKDAHNLRHLRASRNLFRRLPLRLLAKQQSQARAAKLESFDVGKNRYLTQLTRDQNEPLQTSLAPLTSLNLSDCSLTDQFIAANQMSPMQFFASLNELISISMQNNKLRDLLATANLFAKNNKLQRLDLSFNQLNSLNGHLFNANASQLSELQLHHNHLREIPEHFLFNLKKLRHLSLAYNQLTQLSSKIFLTNQLIETIDLSHNQLITLNTQTSGMIPFGNGANLKYLNLAHNNLSDFESDLFDLAWSFYTSLNSLDLSHNNFTGRISMPIFYTIADEMLLNLASNHIQSISVDALVQHEQLLDRYATFETADIASDQLVNGPAKANNVQSHHGNNNKVPTVNIRLANNPIACDCMLEPLISYTRRVAAATNPNLIASIFNSTSADGHLDHKQQRQQQRLSPASSRYSFSEYQAGAGSNNDHAGAAKQPQVLYQFKLNDLYCAQPKTLERRLVSHISIGDLLCPIVDERLCPRPCDCHYQSAFKTAIVDCNGRQLEHIPEQLTDAANFLQFDVVLFDGSGGWSNNKNASDGHVRRSRRGSNTATSTISTVDKVIIRLDNNRLSSMEQLSRLFNVVSTPSAGASVEQRQRFARAPSSANNLRASPSNDHNQQVIPAAPVALPTRGHLEDSTFEDVSETMDTYGVTNGRAVAAAANNNDQLKAQEPKKKISPAAIARGIHSSSSTVADVSKQRSKRQADNSATTQPDEPSLNRLQIEGTETNFDHFGPAATAVEDQPLTHQPLSTSVLESAEEFRNKRYPLTCELYLDHNSISELPESFLDQLDQVRASSMETSLIPPQAALPTNMLEPPVHSKLSSHHLMAPSDGSLATSNADPMRASSSNAISSALSASQDAPAGGASDDPPAPSLFGRQVSPLAPEKKAALLETISENVERLNKLTYQQGPSQQADSDRHKVTVSPSLVVLSLRYNNLGNINARMLQRLSKLIKSSNTKLYFGHNPFNCSDNFLSSANTTINPILQAPNGRQIVPPPTSPMGDTLAASDSTSGAYLEPAPDSFSPSSAGADLSTAASEPTGQLSTSSDCPVGQLKTWLTSHHSNVGDLDELYCVHMPDELADRLKLNATSQMQVFASGTTSSQPSSDRLARAVSSDAGLGRHWDHDHPWASGLNFAPTATAGSPASSGGRAPVGSNNSLITKNGYTWNGEILMASAKLIDVDLYELCPYSGRQLDASALGFLSAGHQQVLMSVAILFIMISLCLLLMLVYFGDTQTILAFVYIHMNPIYNCMKLNESHLDGEKLYDAFVSYSSADRDIVMELIERLEQQQQTVSDAANITNKPSSLDKSRDTLVTEADLRPDFGVAGPPLGGGGEANNTLSNRRSASSFQDLGTLSRSTSRMTLGSGRADSRVGSAFELSARADQQDPRHHRPYRLCIHERDWLPGHLISWNIVNSVQNSRRTILILSKDFIKSVWFQVEFHTAYYQMLEDKIDRLIVIVRGELPPKSELDKNLAFLLTTKTYLTWGEKWFWERLHYALPHRSGGAPGAHVMSRPRENGRKANETIKAKQSATNLKAGSLLNTLTTGNAASTQSQNGNPLLMSNIGKDCSNLLPIANQNNQQAASSACSSSSSSSSNGSHATRSSSSSFLSGSSTNNLFAGRDDHNGNQIITTSNDLLSSTASPIRPTSGGNNTTRLSIGGGGGMRTSSPLPLDSGRVTGTTLSSSGSSVGQRHQLTSGEVTSIMLDGNGGATGASGHPINSRMRAKKQEKLQSFVDKEISNRLNLSEL